MHFRGETIKFSSRLKKENSLKIINIQNEIEDLEKDLHEHNFEKLNQKKEELQTLRKAEVEGLKIRTRATWLNEGEKPSKYLASLEAKNYVDKTIRKLMRTDGSILTDQKTILKEVRDFYSKLFQNKQHIADSHLSDHYKLSLMYRAVLKCVQ